MTRNHSIQAVLLMLCVVTAGALLLTACSPTETEPQAEQTTPDTASPSPSGEDTTPDQAVSEPAPEPVAPTYDGTDPNEIIGQLCAIAGCHDSASLLAYSADPDAVRRKMESMGDEDYSNLTPEQIEALVTFYTAAE